MSNWIVVVVVVLVSVLLVGCNGKRSKPEPKHEEGKKMEPKSEERSEKMTEKSEQIAVIETDYGKIKFNFFTDVAPKTCARIKQLIEEGFYNGLTFHRIVPGFVIQGGDPEGTGGGGTGVNLKAEFNNRKHTRGTVAMARAADPDSADCQFYICLDRIQDLDRKYTIFGQVIEGMDAVDGIAAVRRIGERPAEKVVMRTVYLEETLR